MHCGIYLSIMELGETRCFDYNIQTQHHRNIGYQEHPEHSFKSEYRALMARSWPEIKDVNPYGRIRDARLYAEARCIPLSCIFNPINHRESGQPWYVELDDDSVAICDLDWRVPSDNEIMMLENVSMLLLASGVGGEQGTDLLEMVQSDIFSGS
jgi:hypothetical protein